MSNRERSLQPKEIMEIGLSLGALWFVFNTFNLAFSTKVRNRIKEEADGRCQDCNEEVGNEHLIAAHLIHGTASHLDKVHNGVARCLKCEARYHLMHADNPQNIGLRKQDNDAVVYGHVHQLDEFDQEVLLYEYRTIWAGVLKRLGKVE